jgi:hypothetical protein
VATVTATDLDAANGVVHVIDAVLMPMPMPDDMDTMDDGGMDEEMPEDDGN